MAHHADQRWIATVKPDVTLAVLALRDDTAFQERFFSRIDTRAAGDDECHIWTGALSDEGYGNVRVGSRVARVHRVAYVLRWGAPPDDAPYLDHVWPICRYRFCCNTAHLEPVTPGENVRRGRGIGKAEQRAMRWRALTARDEWDAIAA